MWMPSAVPSTNSDQERGPSRALTSGPRGINEGHYPGPRRHAGLMAGYVIRLRRAADTRPCKGRATYKSSRTIDHYRIGCTTYMTSPRTVSLGPAEFDRSIESGARTNIPRISHASRTWPGSLKPRRLIRYIYMAMTTGQTSS